MQEKKPSIVYPSRPKRDTKAEERDRKTRVICNLRQISLNSSSHQVRQYAIHFEPEIAEDNNPLKNKLLRQIRQDLHKHFQKYIPAGDTLFVCSANPIEKVVIETKLDDILYKVQFVLTKNIIDCRNIRSRTKDHIKIKHVIEILIKNIIQSNNHIVKFDDRSFYDYFDLETFGRDGKGKIWHGYSTAVCITENGLFLRINDKNRRTEKHETIPWPYQSGHFRQVRRTTRYGTENICQCYFSASAENASRDRESVKEHVFIRSHSHSGKYQGIRVLVLQ